MVTSKSDCHPLCCMKPLCTIPAGLPLLMIKSLPLNFWGQGFCRAIRFLYLGNRAPFVIRHLDRAVRLGFLRWHWVPCCQAAVDCCCWISPAQFWGIIHRPFPDIVLALADFVPEWEQHPSFHWPMPLETETPQWTLSCPRCHDAGPFFGCSFP